MQKEVLTVAVNSSCDSLSNRIPCPQEFLHLLGVPASASLWPGAPMCVDLSRPGTRQRHRELDVSGREGQGLEGWDIFHVAFWLLAILWEKHFFVEE